MPPETEPSNSSLYSDARPVRFNTAVSSRFPSPSVPAFATSRVGAPAAEAWITALDAGCQVPRLPVLPQPLGQHFLTPWRAASVAPPAARPPRPPWFPRVLPQPTVTENLAGARLLPSLSYACAFVTCTLDTRARPDPNRTESFCQKCHNLCSHNISFVISSKYVSDHNPSPTSRLSRRPHEQRRHGSACSCGPRNVVCDPGLGRRTGRSDHSSPSTRHLGDLRQAARLLALPQVSHVLNRNLKPASPCY